MRKGHHHKGRYNPKLIEVNGKLILKSLIDRWTYLAKECYNRGCICNGCNILPKLETLENCEIKNYVRGYFLRGIYPRNEENNDN